MLRKIPILILLSLLLSTSIKAMDEHKCTHDETEHPEPEIDDLAEGIPSGEDRRLQQYPQFRMKAYTGYLVAEQSFIDYINNDLVPPIIDYMQGALKIRYPLPTGINFYAPTKTVCYYGVPAELYAGIPYDFWWLIVGANDPGSTWIADSYSCNLVSGTHRPYVGRTKINTAMFYPAGNNVLLHERNIICIMHELTHTLGFSVSMYGYFVDNNGTQLQGHILTVPLDGMNGTVLNVEPLTTKLRQYFGCASLQGAYMENQGGDGSAGSHFERRHFFYEAMTSGMIDQMQYSPLTLALLESTGWYTADYSYGDPFYFGQGQGCDFLMGSCTPGSYPEFCNQAGGCVMTGIGGGSCVSDWRSDNCKFIQPRSQYSCEDPNNQKIFRTQELQVFGRTSGAKCFDGTLNSNKTSPSYSIFCFKPVCETKNTAAYGSLKPVYQTTLYLQANTTVITCTQEGQVTVPGYVGTINCPDPVEYCSTTGAPVCPRGCMGRGTCVNGVCSCKSGFKGKDCALNSTNPEYAGL